jgi:hypothetical protein
MSDLSEVAPAFVAVAHRIVWATVATVDTKGRPRSRILHPLWEWDGDQLVGWIATGPTPVKQAHLAKTPFVSVNYWDSQQDVATAECHAELQFDDETRTRVWHAFANAPEPVGYDPAIVPVWTRPTDVTFAALRLDPWRLRVMPGSMMLGGAGALLTWKG